MELAILKDIVIIFALSTLVNLIFTRIKVPTVIGYIVTGIVAGPHLLALIEAPHEIELMAEIGVVLLMFTIGLEFSLQHLIKIRKAVFFGGFIQFSLTTILIFFLSRFYGITTSSGLFIGFLTALSSTAIVLKLLQERSEITSNYGRTILGILIFQDILLVPLILLTNIMGGDEVDLSRQIIVLSIKALVILAFVYLGNKWIVPYLLNFIIQRKNQELYLMSILLVCLSVALLTSKLGMSLAFGAFLAGLMISGSEYSHNAFADLIPFKDTFTSFFFVSIGMLLDLNFIADNLWLVMVTLIIVLSIKTFIAGGTGFILGHTFRGTIVVGLALCQVGEFSFILAKIGHNANLISDFYFQLFLAVAVISMSFTPLLIMVSGPLSDILLKLPLPRFWIEGLFPLPEAPVPEMSNHLVIIGKDLRANRLALLSKNNNIPYISIIFDPGIVQERMKAKEPVIYGDAQNEPILRKAYVDQAEIVVVSVGDIIASSAIVEKVREINPHVHILARTKYIDDMEILYSQGANHVVPEKFETTIELFHQLLKKKLIPPQEISDIIDKIRKDHYGLFSNNSKTGTSILIDELPDFEINAFKIKEEAPVVGLKLKDIGLRSETGVTLLAVKRKDEVFEHPHGDFIFQADDCLYLLGRPEQLSLARKFIDK